MILIILSLFIILTYVITIIYKNGIPYSISDTFYSLEHKLWFGITMWLTALLLIPKILDMTPENYQCLSFLMCTGLIFVGAAPNFKEGIERPIHIISTSIAAVCSQLWIIFTLPYMLLIWIIWFIYIIIRLKKLWDRNLYNSFVKCKPLFWAEVIMFMMIYIVLFINL